MRNFDIECPEVYGDPGIAGATYLFPEFKKSENPTCDYVIIPAYNEITSFAGILRMNVSFCQPIHGM